MPLITVLIPMFNAEPYIRAAVESVLAQKDVELELIIIDDGSSDRSAEIVRSITDPRIRIIPGPQRGISAAFNAGLNEAKGEFLARCDADDLYAPDRLKWQLDFLAEHADFGAVCGAFTTMTADGKTVAESKSDAREVTAELQNGRGPSHVCACLFRTELLRQLKGCREFFVTAEDVDLQLRLSEITRIWYEPRIAYLYRLHDASITHVQKSAQRTFFEDCAREFQRQRKSRGTVDDLELGWAPQVPSGKGAARSSARQQTQQLLLGQAWAAHGAGRRGEGLSLGLRAWMTNPLRLKVLKSVVALAVKPAR